MLRHARRAAIGTLLAIILPVTAVAQSPSAPPEPYDIVALGDSIMSANGCPGCTTFLAQLAGTGELGIPGAVLHDHSFPSTAPAVTAQIQGDPDVQQDIRGADLVIVTVGYNDITWGDWSDPCWAEADVPAIDWAGVTDECVDRSAVRFEARLDDVVQNIAATRRGPVPILLTTVFNNAIGNDVDPSWGDPEAVEPSVRAVDAWYDVTCRVAQAHPGAVCVDTYHAMNGPDGRTAAAPYLDKPSHDDYTHLNQAGHDLFARLLLESIETLPAGGMAQDAPPSGAIVYMTYDEPSDGWRSWIMCPDGSGKLAYTPVGDASTGGPVFSPDGSMVAFYSDRDTRGLPDAASYSDVFVAGADGSWARKLTDSTMLAVEQAISPDGTRVAFEVQGPDPADRGIYEVGTDGSGLRRLTTAPAGTDDATPRYSPDGEWLVFTRYLNNDTAQSFRYETALFVMPAGGGDPVRITSGTLNPGDATWSPDGQWLAFEIYGSEAAVRGDSYLIRPDGSGLTNLTEAVAPGDLTFGSADPVWSPDGTLILLPSGTSTSGGLATIRRDGTGYTILVEGEFHQPDWSATADCGA